LTSISSKSFSVFVDAKKKKKAQVQAFLPFNTQQISNLSISVIRFFIQIVDLKLIFYSCRAQFKQSCKKKKL